MRIKKNAEMGSFGHGRKHWLKYSHALRRVWCYDTGLANVAVRMGY